MPYMPKGALIDLNAQDVGDSVVEGSTPARGARADGVLSANANSTSAQIKFAYDERGWKCIETVVNPSPSGSGSDKRVLDIAVSPDPHWYVEFASKVATGFLVVQLPTPLPSNVSSSTAPCGVVRSLEGGINAAYFNSSRHLTYIPEIYNNRDGADGFIDLTSYEEGVLVFAQVIGSEYEKTFLNGVLCGSIAKGHGVVDGGARYPSTAVGARFYRSIAYEREFSDAEVQGVTEEILRHFRAIPQTVSWSAPSHDGGAPVTGYEIHALSGDGAVTQVKVQDPEASEAAFTAPPSVAVQVYAVNKFGRSIPAEVEL